MTQAQIRIPVDSLLKLPSGASYHAKNGQANADITKDGNEVQFVATCDSLARETYRYAKLYHASNIENERLRNEIKNEKNGGTNPLKTIFVSGTIGLLIGIMITLTIILLKNGKK